MKHLYLFLATTLLLPGCLNNDSDNKSSEEELIDNALKSSSELESYLKRGLITEHAQRYSSPPSSQPQPEESEVATDAGSGESDDQNFSTTNTQEADVDEADFIKFNGEYLYAFSPKDYDIVDSKQKINIYKTDSEPVRSQLAGQHDLSDQSASLDGMYLVDNYLVTLTQAGSYYAYYDIATELTIIDESENPQPAPENPQPFAASMTFLSLEDPAKPEQQFQLNIEGTVITSRRVGDYLYLVSRFQPQLQRTKEDISDINHWNQKVLQTPVEELLPRYWVNGELQGSLFNNEGCYLPDMEEQGGYHNLITLVKVDLTNPRQWQSKCSSGRVSDVYASDQSLVLAASYWNNNTRLDQFSLTDLTLAASGDIPGFLQWPMPRFRLSEKDGYLRVITSHSWFNRMVDDIDNSGITEIEAAQPGAEDSDIPSWQNAHHRLYVLKANNQQTFDQVAVIPNTTRDTVIGKPGEEVKSVRYRGDRAYIVTFRQTDPLYVINLSDPSDPYVEGELEIEGFSQYLHPITDNLLLGLGIDADEFGNTQGLKASLFDVSNPANPTEISSQRFGENGWNASYLNDPRSVSFLTTGEQNNRNTRLAFTWDGGSYYNDRSSQLRVMDINHQTTDMTLVTEHTYAGSNSAQAFRRNAYSRVPLHSDGLHLVVGGVVTSGPISDFQ